MGWVKLADGTLDDITTGGAQRVGDGSYQGWSQVAAETFDGQNKVLWMHSSGKLSEWNVDLNWNYQSHEEYLSGSDKFFQAENNYNLDFNNDKKIGIIDDFNDNINTKGKLTLSNSETGELEFEGDHDWFEVRLEAGKNYKFDLVGNSLRDPYLYLRDSSGNLLTYNDDGGEGLNSQITFQASTNGQYFLDAGAFDDSYTGTYTLSGEQLATPDLSFSSTDGYGLANAKHAFENLLDISLSEQPELGGNLWGLDYIDVPEVWAGGSNFNGVTGENVTIAVIDTGVDIHHNEFRGRITTGYDFVDDDSIAHDGHGHGTHVAGTIAGANDGIGITGVAYDAAIMPLRVLGNDGYGWTSDIISAVRWAADNGADVINMSLGGGGYSQAMAEAIRYASELGSVVVMAAGNVSGNSPEHPAAHAINHGIAVGAVDSNRSLAGFSNRAGSTELDYVTAPGVDIYSSVPGGGYSFASGTSMAAPHVSGIAGLLKSHDSSLSAETIEDLITGTGSNNTSSTSRNTLASSNWLSSNWIPTDLITLQTLDDFSDEELSGRLIASVEGDRQERRSTIKKLRSEISANNTSYDGLESITPIDKTSDNFAVLEISNATTTDQHTLLTDLLTNNHFHYFEVEQKFWIV